MTELVINLNAAKALNLDVPATLLARADDVVRASAERELETAFATLVRERADALLVGADTFFTSEPTLFAVLTARHAIPAIYPWRSHVDAGGLMSYGASLIDAYRQTGV